MPEADVVRIAYRPRAGLQHPFHAARYRARYRAMFAGTGGGKTHAGAFEVLSWMLDNPGCRGAASEPDVPMVKKSMIPEFEKVLGLPNGRWHEHPLIAVWRVTDNYLRLVNGSELWMVGLDKLGKVEGMNLDFWWADEIRLVRNWPEQWKIIRARLRGSRPGNRTGAWVTTHSPLAHQAAFFEGPEKDPNAVCFRWASTDNPTLGPEFLDDLLRTYPEGPQRDAVVRGLVSRPHGAVYPNFNPEVHVVDPAKALQAFPEKRWERLSYGVDWGYEDPAVLTAWGWVGRRAWGLEEIYVRRRTPQELVQLAVDLQARHGAGIWYCGHDRPEHIRDFNDNGLAAVPNKGKVEDGIETLDGMWKAGDLHIAPSMTNLRRELDLYVRTDTGDPADADNHAPDSMRYGIMGGRSQLQGGVW